MPRVLRRAVMAICVLAGAVLPAAAFEVETGFEALRDPQTKIEGLHRLYIGHEVASGLSFGQAIYSAASGDAGGAFFWGFEAVKTQPLTDNLSLKLQGFIGGGGGAAQVVGDGLMLRAGAALDYALSPHWGAQAGASWMRIAGANIDGPALGIGLHYAVDPEEVRQGGALSLPLRSVSLGAAQVVARSGAQTRAGAPQPDLSLVGAEAAFLLSGRNELTFGAAGAAKGGEGYMQVMGGLRHRIPLGPVDLFGEAALGFGGGGEVDTGAGALVSVAGGVSVPLANWLDLDLALGGTKALTGDHGGGVASVRLTRVFKRAPDQLTTGKPQKWAYSFGLSMQDPNSTFRKAGAVGSGRPIMQESSVDMFLTERLYLTGNAQTAMGGEVAGYAIGLLGLGYEMPLSPRWSASLEAHLGAAGGGGVNATGGLIGGLRGEVDYALRDNLRLSLGLGTLRALKSGGLAPVVATVGLKIPFETR